MRRKLIIGIAVAVIIVAAGIGALTVRSTMLSPEHQMELAYKYMDEGKYEEAIIAFEKALSFDENNVDALMGISEAYFEMEDYASAESYLEEVIDIEEDNDDAIKLMAEALIAMGRYKEAYDILNSVDEGDMTRSMERMRDMILTEYLPKQPEPDVAPGTYKTSVDVSLQTDNDEEIFYTLDGTDPDESSMAYDTPIRLQKSTVIKAISMSTSGIVSDVMEMPYVIEQEVEIVIEQVDNRYFPTVTMYTKIVDALGDIVEDFDAAYIEVEETDGQGGVGRYKIDELYELDTMDAIKINLVMDTSSSMTEENRIYSAKSAAKEFIGQVDYSRGDQVGLISFNSEVYLNLFMTDDASGLKMGVDSLEVDGLTALYDALYTAIVQTYKEDGAKCVIAYTDGQENQSRYSRNEVIELSKSTGVPVYIVGIGSGIDDNDLRYIAENCSGRYFNVADIDTEQMLGAIYNEIYTAQKDLYVLKFTSDKEVNLNQVRNLKIVTSEGAPYIGEAEKTYVPEPEIDISYTNFIFKSAYILPRGHEDRLPMAISICEYDGIPVEDLVFIRYMSSDGTQSFVLASPDYDPQLVFQYAMEKIDGKWQVLARYDWTVDANQAIAKDIPTFNRGMLPWYDLSDYDFDHISEEEIQRAMAVFKANGLCYSSEIYNYVTVVDGFLFIITDRKTRLFAEWDGDNVRYPRNLDINEPFIIYHNVFQGKPTRPTFMFLQD